MTGSYEGRFLTSKIRSTAATLRAFADHGQLEAILPADAEDAEKILLAHGEAGIQVDELAERLQREGAEAFAASWRDLLASIEAKCAALGAAASAAAT